MRKKAPAAARRRGVGGEAALRQGFAKLVTEEERCWGGEGLRLGCCLQPSPHPSIYREKGKGGGPSRWDLEGGGDQRGGGLPPKQGGGAPLRVPSQP